MNLKFTKMHGLGNDYIYFDCLKKPLGVPPQKLARVLSDRHFGIGGDGIVLMEPSGAADCFMRMFNLDGSEGKMCGNAIRCVAKYLYDNRLVRKEIMKIETLSGVKKLSVKAEGGEAAQVTVDMGPAVFDPKAIPANFAGGEVVNREIVIAKKPFAVTLVSMGNPHCVVFCKEVSKLNLAHLGPLFEKNDLFPEGVNTEFVQMESPESILMRVWERGSGETMACGTGACASVAAAVKNGLCEKNQQVRVQLLGGDLGVTVTDGAVFMTGPAKKVFSGTVNVEKDTCEIVE